MKPYLIIGAAGLAVLVGCSGGSTTLAPANPPLSAQDRSFLSFAAQSSNSEIAAANVALRQSTTQSVTSYAQQMINDHNNANASEASVGKSFGFVPPTSPDPNEAAKLQTFQGQTGTSFDQAYANDQVAGHQNTIAQFQTEISSGHNSAVIQFAQTQLPILQNHLAGAQSIVQSGQ